jgi:hypothetical protein
MPRPGLALLYSRNARNTLAAKHPLIPATSFKHTSH